MSLKRDFFYCHVEIMVIQFDLAIAFARDGMISTYTLSSSSWIKHNNHELLLEYLLLILMCFNTEELQNSESIQSC